MRAVRALKKAVSVLPVLGLGAALVWAVAALPEPLLDLPARVREALPYRGVSNPVAAVLLNFRGYDTLLEMAVLLLAVLAVWSLGVPALPGSQPAGVPADTGPVLASLVRTLVPVIVVTAGYLVWLGAHAPGGAFQGGAVLAGAGVLMLLAGLLDPPRAHGWHLRAGLVLGLAVFAAVAGAALLAGGALLEYPRRWAGGLILLIETALTVSVGLTLTLLFVGAPSPPHAPAPSEAT